MPRAPRVTVGGYIYHVLNRANGRATLFKSDEDYSMFEQVLIEAQQRINMRLTGYCIMPNHWHLILWPRDDGDLPEFMRLVGVTHTQRWHAVHGTAGCGHLYQGRYKSFLIQRRRPSQSQRQAGAIEGPNPLHQVLCYVERNALAAGLVSRAEDWRWCSLALRLAAEEASDCRPSLCDIPGGLPSHWLKRVNRARTDKESKELRRLHRSVLRGRPYGDEAWSKRIASQFGLESTFRPRGRPKKGS